MASPSAPILRALPTAAHPDWTPDQIKEQITERAREVLVPSGPNGELVEADEAAADKAVFRRAAGSANDGLALSTLLDPATGQIDYTRASWSRASWSDAVDPLRASWSRASWSTSFSK